VLIGRDGDGERRIFSDFILRPTKWQASVPPVRRADSKFDPGAASGPRRVVQAFCSELCGQRRVWAPKARDRIYEGQAKPYWYPDGRSGPVRFEDKFGVNAELSPNQILAQQALGDNFQLYHFLPADFGKAAAVPVAAAAPHVTPSRRRR
jgi:hypothetical protein